MTNPRVIITGKDHPHYGKRGTAVAVQSFKHGIMPPMVEIRFEDGSGCFAKKEDVQIDPFTCERCGGHMAHSRLNGLFCPACRRKR